MADRGRGQTKNTCGEQPVCDSSSLRPTTRSPVNHSITSCLHTTIQATTEQKSKFNVFG